MKRTSFIIISIIFNFIFSITANAHFQEIIPSNDIIEDNDKNNINIALKFTHPMENGPIMNMEKPSKFGVIFGNKKIDLKEKLIKNNVNGNKKWNAKYEITSPDNYIFYVEPEPYFEPAENKMIIHYSKVIVDAFGAGEGWDKMVGFPVEIEPLTRPYGLWTNNIFSGIVKKEGKVVPFAEIEVEYISHGKVKVPSEPYITQVIKADQFGKFSYAMPKAGWWGFAALIDGDKKIKNNKGEDKDVELGALIWVRTRDIE